MFMNNMKSSGRQQAAGIFLLKYRKRVGPFVLVRLYYIVVRLLKSLTRKTRDEREDK